MCEGNVRLVWQSNRSLRHSVVVVVVVVVRFFFALAHSFCPQQRCDCATMTKVLNIEVEGVADDDGDCD